jgi:sugar lactone lactonase YvrE
VVLTEELTWLSRLVSAGSPTAGILAAGQSCLLSISFTPPIVANFNGALVLTDNALNGVPSGYTAQSILLSGTGAGSTQQSITFEAIQAQVANSAFALTATASSGLPVSFTSTTTAICTISGSTVLLVAAGGCTIQANQTGSSVYAAAPPVTQSFTVTLLAQTITFGTIANQALDTSIGVTLTATASSGLPVSFVSTTPTICTVSGSTASLLAAGTCTVQANQPGDGVVYGAAPMVTQSFTVGSANPLTDMSFGTVNIGSASATVAVPITFGTAATLGSLSVLTQGATGLDFANASAGTCAVGSSYNSGASCTVNVSFTPTLAGTRYGAVVLEDGSGNVVATGYLQGTGVGPQINFLPVAESTVPSSALSYPSGVAVDAIGNIYLADTYNNRILKETVSAGNYTESTVPTSSVNYPSGIAVDGSGSIYVADTGNNRILKETPSAGSYTESTVSTSALAYPYGVTVDGSGNVYIADTYNQRILIETRSATGYTETTVPTSSMNAPSGIAVDGSGNVFIIDSGNNRVLKETLSAGSYTENTVPTSALNFPSGIAADGSGSIYVADSGNNRILKETLSAGSYTESTASASVLNWPSGIAVAASGNLYVADTGNNRTLKEDLADPPSVAFATAVMGSTSNDSPQMITLVNVGNATLGFPIPSNGNNPNISVNFTLNSNGASSCPLMSASSSAAGTLAVGQSCLLPISFAPTVAGNLSGALVLTDNVLNAAAPGYATQTLFLSGIGTGSTQQTITFGTIPSQISNSVLALTATANSGLAVSFVSTTPSICSISGSTASLVVAGICTIQANQSGSSVYSAAPPVTQSFPVTVLAQTISFSPIPNQVLSTSVGVTLIATASSGLPVSFTSTTPTICTVLSSVVSLLAPGTCTIQVAQTGNAVYATAPTVTQSFTIASVNPLTGANFATVNIGSTSSAISVPITYSVGGTLGSVNVLTQGATGLDFANVGAGTCTVGSSYKAGDSCTVIASFTPTHAGARYGAVVLEDGSGNVAATGYLQGTGIGPQLNFLPGAESMVSSSVQASPSGVAVDASGNIYIADSSNNRVLRETLSAGSYIESTVPTSALNYPSGIAVDGGGNLYVADYGNSRILKETLSAGSYIESTVSTSALDYPYGVTVDGSGNIYIADTYNQRILIETPSATGYTESTVPTSSLDSPSGIAVDGSGNLYIADSYNQRVLKETSTVDGYNESTLSTSAVNPQEIAVDGSGNVYITDSGNNRILKETISAGNYIESTIPSSAINYPSGVAVDGSGNVYIADTGNNRTLKEDFADPPNLSFAITAPGSISSDSPQTVTVENVGNAGLSLPIRASGENPDIFCEFHSKQQWGIRLSASERQFFGGGDAYRRPVLPVRHQLHADGNGRFQRCAGID